MSELWLVAFFLVPLLAVITALLLSMYSGGDTCACGEPDAEGVVHRTDGPCYFDW